MIGGSTASVMIDVVRVQAGFGSGGWTGRLAHSDCGTVTQSSSEMHAGSPEGIDANATSGLRHAFNGFLLGSFALLRSPQGFGFEPTQAFVLWANGSPVTGSTYSAFQVTV